MSKRLRSYVAAIMAMLFAFAIVAVPQKAWAQPTTENPVKTPYGEISYIADPDGFNMKVELYLNDEATPAYQVELPKIDGAAGGAGKIGNLKFTPSDEGVHYHGGERSFSLKANLSSAGWDYLNGKVFFGGDQSAQKDYENVLKIYLYTFSRQESFRLNVTADNLVHLGNNNPADHVIGYIVSYDAVDPVTHQSRTFSHEVTSSTVGSLDFANQTLPINTPLTITAICDAGYEAAQWYVADVTGVGTVLSGDEGTSGIYKVGNVATLTEKNENTAPTLHINQVREALPPNTDKDAALTAEVTVKCINDYAGHASSTVPLEESTYNLGNASGQGQGRTLDATVDSTSYITAFSEGKGDHTLTSADNVITFVHDGRGWVPAENESPLVFEVTCDAKPGEPSQDQLDEIIGKNILVSCTNAASGHLTGHYSLSEGEYEGALASGEDGYTYTVTVKANKFVAAYSDATKTPHSLVGADTAIVTLVNNGTGWMIQSGTPVEFEVVCTSAPTLDDITAAFDGELVKVKCTNDNNEHGYDTRKYGAISGGVEIGKVADDGTVVITVSPGAYAAKYGEDVKLGHYLDPFDQQPKEVTLTLGADGKWVAPDGFVPIEVTVKCANAPIPDLPRTEDEFKATFTDAAIHVVCVTDEDHIVQKYVPIEGYYTYGDVKGNADTGYTVTMTVGPDHYVNLYNETFGKMHVLVDGQDAEKVINLKCTDGKNWVVADNSAPVTYKVKCVDDDPYQPGKPTVDEIQKLLSGGPVLIDCISNVGHEDRHYNLSDFDGTYTISDVQGDKVKGYTSSITINADEYVKAFSTFNGSEHQLAEGQSDSVTIEFKYDNGAWALVDPSITQAKFEVTCKLPAPTYDELKTFFEGQIRVSCTANSKHAEKSYGLNENSYTVTDPVMGSDGKYTADVTVFPEKYVENFVTAYSGVAHNLDPDTQSQGFVVSFTYDTTSRSWTLANSDAMPIWIKVACEPVGTITVTPADMTIYQGATSGYEAVVGENGETTEMTENALPEPLFVVKSSTGDIPEGIKFYNNDNVWTLEDKGNGYYRFVNEGEGDPVRIQFTDAVSGNTIVSSKFDPFFTGDSYRQLTISIYPGESGSSSATAMAGDAPYAVNTGKGTLTIRAVADDDAVDPIKNDAPTSAELDAADAVAVEPEDGTTYTLNNTGVELDSDAEPSLLFDSIIDDAEVNRTQLLENEIDAQPGIDSGFQSEIKYLDLVDASNGNAWIKSSNGVDIYWDYPDRTDQSTEFKVMHFSGLHRDGAESGFDPEDIDGATIKNVTIEKTDDGIKFHVEEGNFSPYALVWDYEDNGGTTPGGDGGTTTKYYKIEASAGEGGSISPSGTVKVAAGTDKTFTITPDEGYAIGSVIVDGVNYRQISSYTFEDVDKDYTISVTFMRGNDPANPDDTGVSDWLETDDHIVFLHGYGDGSGTFGPENQMTRAEVAQMFYNLLLDKSRGDKPVSFTDVPADAYYAEPVFTLASLGIVNGTSPETFEPNRPITRAEFVAIAMRFTNGEFEGENLFVDVPEDAWYRDYVVGAVGYGWIYGYQDGSQKFGPLDTITRGQATMVTNRMLWRACDTVWAMEHMDQLKTFVDLGQSHYAFFDVVEATNAHDYTRVGDTRYENWTGLVK